MCSAAPFGAVPSPDGRRRAEALRKVFIWLLFLAEARDEVRERVLHMIIDEGVQPVGHL